MVGSARRSLAVAHRHGCRCWRRMVTGSLMPGCRLRPCRASTRCRRRAAQLGLGIVEQLGQEALERVLERHGSGAAWQTVGMLEAWLAVSTHLGVGLPVAKRRRPTLRPGACCRGGLEPVLVLAARPGPGEVEAVGVGLGRDQRGIDRISPCADTRCIADQATLRGRPPRRPLARDAACLAGVCALPPSWPMRAAAQDFEPSRPSSKAGR